MRTPLPGSSHNEGADQCPITAALLEERFKEQAERLRQFLAAAGVDLKHTTSLQAVARMHGAHDWRSLVAEHRPTTPPANKSEPATDLSKPTNQYAITTTYKGQ